MKGLYIILGIIAVLFVIVIFIYNRLVMLNNRCKNAWAGIDNQLKRRADLIPNLVDVTKGYAKHESETLLACIEARNTSITDQARQSEEVSKNLKKLLAVAEAYPDLKANKLFENLQIELTGTEDKLAYARQFYNDSVQLFNTSIQIFPNNLLANMLKYKEKEYFKIDDAEREVVEVKL